MRDETPKLTTYGEEAAYSDRKWVDWAVRDASGVETATFVALRGGDGVGIVGAYHDDDDISLYHVYAMWVAPECRGQGLARRLLDAIEKWITAAGGAVVHLEVADTAVAAASLYTSAGYSRDGLQSPSPHAPGITHVSMRKCLA